MDQSENVGSFHPVEITAVHALDVPGSRPPMSESIPAEVDAAIAKMIPGVEDIMGEETEQLTDIGGTDKLQHVINTEAPPPNQARYYADCHSVVTKRSEKWWTGYCTDY